MKPKSLRDLKDMASKPLPDNSTGETYVYEILGIYCFYHLIDTKVYCRQSVHVLYTLLILD